MKSNNSKIVSSFVLAVVCLALAVVFVFVGFVCLRSAKDEKIPQFEELSEDIVKADVKSTGKVVKVLGDVKNMSMVSGRQPKGYWVLLDNNNIICVSTLNESLQAKLKELQTNYKSYKDGKTTSLISEPLEVKGRFFKVTNLSCSLGGLRSSGLLESGEAYKVISGYTLHLDSNVVDWSVGYTCGAVVCFIIALFLVIRGISIFMELKNKEIPAPETKQQFKQYENINAVNDIPAVIPVNQPDYNSEMSDRISNNDDYSMPSL